jgi:hypothetical protein
MHKGPIMKLIFASAVTVLAAMPLSAAPANSVWSLTTGPALPYRYMETESVLRRAPQIANPETYAPDALFSQLYPSISADPTPQDATNAPVVASKTRKNLPFEPRGILSSSYVQEFAYIDAYSNTRKFNPNLGFPSIRLSLAMPRFGNGYAGGYQPLQFGFGPIALRFW